VAARPELDSNPGLREGGNTPTGGTERKPTLANRAWEKDETRAYASRKRGPSCYEMRIGRSLAVLARRWAARSVPAAHHFDLAVIVAVVAVGVVQMVAHQVVHVVAVGNRFVPAPRPMLVLPVVPIAGVIRGAPLRVAVADLQAMLVVVIPTVGVMQVAVVEIVDVAVMPDTGVPAVFPVLVVVSAVNVVRHESASFGPSARRLREANSVPVARPRSPG
jgi:hypothetical protein